jgi:hypothetical protein
MTQSTPISQLLVFLSSFTLLAITNRLDICLRRATLYPAELRVQRD